MQNISQTYQKTQKFWDDSMQSDWASAWSILQQIPDSSIWPQTGKVDLLLRH